MPSKLDKAVAKVERGPEIAHISMPIAVPKLVSLLTTFTEDEPNATVRFYNGQLWIEGAVASAVEAAPEA